MRVLGLIPARGGSKGVPRKNLRLLCGKPLLQYTTEAAQSASGLTMVVLSTEDAEIAAMGRLLGVRVLMRPAMLAADETPMIPVAQHAVSALAAEGEHFEAVCLLQPTCPLRRAADIDGAVALLQATGADSVISFVAVGEKHPARMKFIHSDGRVVDPPFAESVEGQRRQELPPLYLREGSIYLTRRQVLMERHSWRGDDCRAWIVPVKRACNVDEEFDFLLAEHLLRSAHAQPA